MTASGPDAIDECSGAHRALEIIAIVAAGVVATVLLALGPRRARAPPAYFFFTAFGTSRVQIATAPQAFD